MLYSYSRLELGASTYVWQSSSQIYITLCKGIHCMRCRIPDPSSWILDHRKAIPDHFHNRVKLDSGFQKNMNSGSWYVDSGFHTRAFGIQKLKFCWIPDFFSQGDLQLQILNWPFLWTQGQLKSIAPSAFRTSRSRLCTIFFFLILTYNLFQFYN